MHDNYLPPTIAGQLNEMKMKIVKIGYTDVMLDDYGSGRGKITISDGEMGAYTYYWGSMGSPLEEFICRTNSGYFSDKLAVERRVFSAKLSVSSIRKFIREELKHELPWYRYHSAQKEMREELKNLEDCHSERDFVEQCEGLPERLYCSDITLTEERDFKDTINSIFTCEPWHFIETVPSRQLVWLGELHVKLKKELTKTK